jgi:hypothetical protein
VNTNKKQTEPKKQAPVKKRQLESARVKHMPSPGTPLAMDDLNEHRSVPSETGENSCNITTIDKEIKL